MAPLYAGSQHSGDACGTCEHFPITSLIWTLSPLSVNCGGWTRSSLWPMVLGPCPANIMGWPNPSSQLGRDHWMKKGSIGHWWSPTLCYQPICTCLLFISNKQFIILIFWVSAFTWIKFNLHIAMLWLSVVAQVARLQLWISKESVINAFPSTPLDPPGSPLAS